MVERISPLVSVCLSLAVAVPVCVGAPVPKPPPPKERATLKGHENSILVVAFSPDGKILASASADKTVKLWDIAKEECLATLAGHSNDVSAIAFSPDGKCLASVGYNNQLRLWDVGTGKEIAFLSKQMGHQNLIFSPDSKTLFVEAVDFGCLQDISSRKLVKRFKMQFGEGSHLAPHSLTYAEDGKLLGVVWRRGGPTADVWDIIANKSLCSLDYPAEYQQCAILSPDHKLLASAGERLRIWDARTGELIGNYERTGQIDCLAFSPDSRLIGLGWKPDPRKVALKQGLVSILDPNSGKELATLKGHTGPLFSIAFSGDGRTLASASADRTIKLWDVRGVKAPKKD